MLPNEVPAPDWSHGAKNPPGADPFAEIHKRLDQISEKMDRCLAEVAAAAAPAPAPAAPRGAAPAPKRSNLLATVPEPAQMQILPESSEPQRLGSLAARDSRVSSFSLRPSAAFASRPSRMSVNSNFHCATSRVSLAISERKSAASLTKSAAGLPRESLAVHLIPFNEYGQPEAVTRQELANRLNQRRRRGVESAERQRRAQAPWATPATTSDKSVKVAQWLTRRSRCDRLWEILDDPHSSWLAWVLSMSLRLTVVLSLVVTLLQTSQEESFLDLKVAAVLETAIDSVFLLEFFCRLLSAPSKATYFADFYNWADMLASTGLLFRASTGMTVATASGADAVHGFLLYVLPVVRLLKLLRYFESLRLLVDAAANSVEALPVLFYTLVLITLSSATIIYLVEVRSNIPSLAHAIWLAIVTMTTVGYGDYAPKSVSGYLFVSVLTTVSVLFFALPVGIIGHEFTAAWHMRRQVLLFARVRKCFLKWGYDGEDVEALFQYADADADGMLNLLEFCELLHEMRLGLDTDSLIELFMLFDPGNEGFIEFSSLLRRLFPDYAELSEEDVEEGDQDKPE
ncbi:Kcnd1 [Symbiodinium sp. CCMP2592]|nr:Kcnd1 [Symbiodinium sp. CCMP2592]